MRLGFISDLHLGDPASKLVRKENDAYRVDSGFSELQSAVGAMCAGGKLDYLVLMGDVFDFSISSWSNAYDASKPFLRAAKDLTREIVYVPGNHDYSAWTLTMQQVNVIRRIAKGEPLKDRWTTTAIVDSRRPVTALSLSDVDPQPGGGYGGLFFDELGGIRFNIAYPNMYVVSRNGTTTLVTHGQYFDEYWSLAMTLAAETFRGELVYGREGWRQSHPAIEDLAAINLPLNELASSGLGQSGPLAAVIGELQRVGKQSAEPANAAKLERYRKRLVALLDRKITFHGIQKLFKEPASDLLLNAVTKELIARLAREASSTSARYNEEFFADETRRQNIDAYLRACDQECVELRARGINVPAPTRVLFGHTHVPIPIADAQRHRFADRDVEFWNTGGWLRDTKADRSAMLFVYDDAMAPGADWSCVSIP